MLPQKRLPLLVRSSNAPTIQASGHVSDPAAKLEGRTSIAASHGLSLNAIQSKDSTLSRMLSLYKRDKLEFENPSTMTKPEAAKLLRDTAENLLQRLRDHNPPDQHSGSHVVVEQQIADIARTLEVAKEKADTVYGKRKWEKGGLAAEKGRDRPRPRDAAKSGRSRTPLGLRRRTPHPASSSQIQRARAVYEGRDTWRPEDGYR